MGFGDFHADGPDWGRVVMVDGGARKDSRLGSWFVTTIVDIIDRYLNYQWI